MREVGTFSFYYGGVGRNHISINVLFAPFNILQQCKLSDIYLEQEFSTNPFGLTRRTPVTNLLIILSIFTSGYINFILLIIIIIIIIY